MKTIIHVNQHIIKRNRKQHLKEPVITVKDYTRTRYASAVEIRGPAKVVYQPDAPLACGAHVWIETYAPVFTD